MDDGLKWFLLIVVLAFDGVFLAAVTTKYLEVKRASYWAAVQGKIVSSKSVARRVDKISSDGPRSKIHDTELRNFAVVKYVFEADGRRVEGGRIGIGEDLGNFQVAEKLKRYPVGAQVTVYYDRNRPSESVLERDIPLRSFEIAILIGILVGLGCVFLLLSSDNIMSGLAALMPDSAQSSAAVFLAVLAILIVVFGYALKDKGAATQKWPSAEGVILASHAQKVKFGKRYRPGISARRLFRDRTTYSYTIDGVTYHSDRTSFGAQTYATFGFFARKAAARFQPGQVLPVFYNPKAPEEAVLIRGAPGQVLVWIAAAALFALAAHLAGIF